MEQVYFNVIVRPMQAVERNVGGRDFYLDALYDYYHPWFYLLPFALVVGVPAQAIGWVCRCGVKLTSGAAAPARATCAACGTTYVGIAAGVLAAADDDVPAGSHPGTT
jgi:hypothetical protein